MNRKKLLAPIVFGLPFLFVLSLGLSGVLVFGTSLLKAEGLAVFTALFLGAAARILWWGHGVRRNLSSLTQAVKGLGQNQWDLPLPSSEVEEIWETTLSFHEIRQMLREKLNTLEGEKEKLSGLLSNLREGIVVSDPGNRIVVANKSAGSLLEIDPAATIGKSLDFFLDGDTKPIFEALIHGEEKADTLFVRAQATIFYRTLLLKNPDGMLIAKACVLYDITESNKLDEMRKAFVANASHELRSPAAGLQAMVDAFDVGGLEDPEQRKKFLGMMKREIARLNAIIGDLLDLSELEREKTFTKKPLPLKKLFEAWLSSYEIQLEKKNIKIQLTCANPDVSLTGSEPDIEKLFRNLLENAMKYTPEAGVIEIGFNAPDGNLVGWVTDSGPGIPKEHLDRIFERFYRVDKSRSRNLGGTGLGLSIAKHAVERHGGKIWAESEEGRGTTFFFKIPLEN